MLSDFLKRLRASSDGVHESDRAPGRQFVAADEMTPDDWATLRLQRHGIDQPTGLFKSTGSSKSFPWPGQ
jgi:hypothetical protein